MMPIRIQLSRAKGWKMPQNTLKVDRTSKYFGNPIKVGGTLRFEVDGSMYEGELTPAIAVELFREYFAGALRSNPTLLEVLRGKNLACWCPLDQPCHADVLLELANK